MGEFMYTAGLVTQWHFSFANYLRGGLLLVLALILSQPGAGWAKGVGDEEVLLAKLNTAAQVQHAEALDKSRRPAARLVFGGTDMVCSGIGVCEDFELDDADVVFAGERNDDFAGSSVFGGTDLNDDGISDVVIGAQREDSGGSDAGAAYAMFGPASGKFPPRDSYRVNSLLPPAHYK